jgi:hypothetical protein
VSRRPSTPTRPTGDTESQKRSKRTLSPRRSTEACHTMCGVRGRKSCGRCRRGELHGLRCGAYELPALFSGRV